jgi:hypothetical protein
VRTTTMTLQSFLADHAICRLWYVSIASPAGSELVLNTDEDAADEDYCDAQSILECVPTGALELDGTVSQDADGEWRWAVDNLRDADLRDCVGSTVLNLKVWAE